MRPSRKGLAVGGPVAALACAALAVGLVAGARDDGEDEGDRARTPASVQPAGTNAASAPGEVPLADGSIRPNRAPEQRSEDCRRRALGSRGDLDAAGRRDFAPRCVVRGDARERGSAAP